MNNSKEKTWTELEGGDNFYRYNMVRNKVSKCTVDHIYADSGFIFMVYKDDEGKTIEKTVTDYSIDFSRDDNQYIIYFESLDKMREYITIRNNKLNEQIKGV